MSKHSVLFCFLEVFAPSPFLQMNESLIGLLCSAPWAEISMKPAENKSKQTNLHIKSAASHGNANEVRVRASSCFFWKLTHKKDKA